jgi:hypothetical protein
MVRHPARILKMRFESHKGRASFDSATMRFASFNLSGERARSPRRVNHNVGARFKRLPAMFQAQPAHAPLF